MASPPIVPLNRTFLARMEGGASRTEKIAKFVPFLGWIVASHLWTKRAGPVRQRLCDQIAARPAAARVAWGPNSRYRTLAQLVCEVAQVEMGWPAAAFVPNDDFAVVFWSYDDGLDFESAMSELEERTEIALGGETVQPFFTRTLGEFVTFLDERCPETFTGS